MKMLRTWVMLRLFARRVDHLDMRGVGGRIKHRVPEKLIATERLSNTSLFLDAIEHLPASRQQLAIVCF